jgi:uncharacterized protein (TIGR03790 family)
LRYLQLIALGAVFFADARGQTPDQVLVVVNKQSVPSRQIGQYYLKKRGVPLANFCAIDTAPEEQIARKIYTEQVEAPIGKCLTAGNLVETILYIVTTYGVPLAIVGTPADSLQNEAASVDSELTLLYQRLHGRTLPLPGAIPNPFFRQKDTPFRHPQFPMYLVTRLAAYDMAGMKGMVDRALIARNTGKFVIDARGGDDTPGNQWLRTAALLLPKDRVLLNEGADVVTNQKDVIGYASWGSNDKQRNQRFLHFHWLPGAIATEFVSTDGRTFRPPPDAWQPGHNWEDKSAWFAGTPQTLTADYIAEGVSGASGQTWEPFLNWCPRPDFVLPAYFAGRNLAESFYLGIQGLSWMNIVVGDPLMRLKP